MFFFQLSLYNYYRLVLYKIKQVHLILVFSVFICVCERERARERERERERERDILLPVGLINYAEGKTLDFHG